MIYFAVDEPRVHLLQHYLAGGWGRPLAGRLQQLTYAELFRTRSIQRGTWIFTALDALTPAELQLVHILQSAARSAGQRVLNDALEALHRGALLEQLHAAGCNDFRVCRADGPLRSLRFPVFVRVAAEHDGNLTPLLHNRGELRRALLYLRLRGIPLRQLLVVEFCDTVCRDGLYRKYSTFRIGDTYVPRYLYAGPHWMVKEHTRDYRDSLVAEELAYVRDPPHSAWVRQVFELAHVDYGRIDYAVLDGRPVVWEINFTPVLAGDPNLGAEAPDQRWIRDLIRPAKELGHAAMRAAFLRVDPGPLPGADIQVEFPADLARAAVRERRAIESNRRVQQRIARWAAAPSAGVIVPLLRRSLGLGDNWNRRPA
ncbi:MAG: hypothetical protein ACLQBJ_18605 [Bryobacteraceae bacterium]